MLREWRRTKARRNASHYPEDYPESKTKAYPKDYPENSINHTQTYG